MTDPTSVTFTTTGGLELRGDAWGPVDGPPVVLAHGGGQTRHSWGGTAEALARDGWYAVAYDHRGHGDSDRAPGGSYSMGDFAADLLDVARQLPSAPVAVGASLGGLASMLVAGELAPGSLRAVVLVDITPRQEPLGVDRILQFMLDRAEEGFATLEEAADAVAAYQPHRPRPSNHDGLRKNLRLDPDGRWRWHWDPRLFNTQAGLRSAANGDRMIVAASRIEVPTLLVRGRMSDLVSPETAAEFLEIAPHAEFVDVSDAGHMVAGDRNDVFTDAVSDFMRRLGA